MKVLLILALFLSGCATQTLVGTPLPQSGPTMRDILDRGIEPVGGVSIRYTDEPEPKKEKQVYIVQAGDPDNTKIPVRKPKPVKIVQARKERNPLDPNFNHNHANDGIQRPGRLPNPDIHIFIPTHLMSQTGAVQPPTETYWPLLEKAMYALPGEFR